MTRRAACALALVLAACAPPSNVSVRDSTAPIGATTRFDAAAFSGDWQVAARFGPAPASVLSVQLDPVSGHLTLNGGGLGPAEGVYQSDVPGVLTPVEPGGATLVVMWIDEDVETAAIGTVSGSYGALLDRDGTIPPDRMQAARDIFEFYGWNVAALVRTSP